MNPFFFGPSDRPLYGVFSRGRAVGGPPRAALLCYPLLGEYMRAHRAFRQLNNLLNRSGFSVLRFDYSCTGDSAGRGEAASLEQWIDDFGWAADELLDTAGTDSLSVVGLRAGALVASRGAAQRNDVDRLVLWDPCVSGENFVTESIGDTLQPGERTVSAEGVPLTPELSAELRASDLRSNPGVPGRSTDVLTSEGSVELDDLAAHLKQEGEHVHSEVIPSSGSWTEADPFGSAYIPEGIIGRIVERLREPARLSA